METIYDYYARLNYEGSRGIFLENRRKIDYVLGRTKHLIRGQATACDVGVGDGYALERLSAFCGRVTWIDCSGYIIDQLKRRFEECGNERVTLIRGDVSELDLGENLFDVIACFDVLEHVPRLDVAMKNLEKWLRSGGILIGTLPFKENLDASMVKCPACGAVFHSFGHCHAFHSLEDIKRALGEGFKIIRFGKVRPFRWPEELARGVYYLIKRFRKQSVPHDTIYFVARVSKLPSLS